MRQRRVLGERVVEARLREHPRRRGRDGHVADEPDEVRDDQRVPEADEALVGTEVDVEQRDPDDGELREPVGVGRRLDQERGALDEVLQRQLDHRVEVALALDDPLAVREGAADALVCRAARHLVDDVEADPDRELEEQVRPAARESAC